MKQNRNKKLLNLLFLNDHMTSEEMANHLGVSSKTIQNMCKELNDEINNYGASVISKKGYGYSLKYNDKNKFDLYFADNGFDYVPNYPSERVNYIIWKLLCNKYTKIDDLLDELYVSKATLTNDVKNAEEIIESYHLIINRKPRYGLSVSGKEYDMRMCLANNMNLYHSDVEKSKIIKKQIDDLIKKELEHNKFRISAVGFNNLSKHIAIQIYRIINNKYIDDDLQNVNDVSINDIAKKIIKKLSNQHNFQINKNEIKYVALLLSANQTVANGNITFDSKTIETVNEMLDAVYDAFGIDLSGDLELKINLCQHLIPLQIRVQNNITTDNPILDDIRKKYPLSNVMASYSAKVINEQYGQVLSESEVGYIALTYALAMEKRKHKPERKNICLVSGYGRINQQLLEYQFKDSLYEYIENIYSIDITEIDKFDYSTIDYVFSTVPINVDIPVPIVQMSMLNSTDQISFIKNLLSKKEKEKLDIFSKDLFIYEKETNKEKILKNMCSLINKKVKINGLYEAVLRREEAGNTVFCNQVALSHPDKAMSNKPLVCVSVLEKPVKWEENKKVMVILLVCIAKDKSEKLTDLYKQLSMIVTNKSYIDRLVKNHNYETLEDIINKIREKEE